MVEMKVFIIMYFFCLTSADIQTFLGGWYLAMSFPNHSRITPMCNRLDIILDSGSTCTCNGTTVPVTTTRGYEFIPSDILLKFPTIVVESSNEVPNALSTICECDGKKRQQIVFRQVNDNCFVQYEMHTGINYTENEPNHAILLVKRAPKTVEELETLCKVDDLKERKGHVICPSMFLS